MRPNHQINGMNKSPRSERNIRINKIKSNKFISDTTTTATK